MGLKKFLARAVYSAKEHSPEILLVAGILGFVGTVVLACTETPKVDKVVKEYKKDMKDINTAVKAAELPYTPEEAKADKFKVAVQAGGKIVKTYAPSIILGTLSIASILASYRILNKRYIAMAGVAASLAKSFEAYRGRVRERYGEETERELYYDLKKSEVVEDDGNGNVTKTELIQKGPLAGVPIYAKFFDEANAQWNKNPSLNLMFLRGVEIEATQKLNENGFLLLNDVYDMLDIPRTDLGNEVGWFIGRGDDFVDFGLFDGDDERKRAFVNGYEPSVLLNFNCIPKIPGDLPKY